MRDAINTALMAKALHHEIANAFGPPEEGLIAPSHGVIFSSLTRNTRGYIEKISNQINGCYANGWYDAAAVMLRRLIETLIIEAFEKHGISSKIKNTSGDFLYLRDLISKTLAEPTWNLSRNCKSALPKLKDVGDKSAHSRRYIAHRNDIDVLIPDIRVTVQELIYLSDLK